MDWVRKITIKWWFWIIATVLFLTVVQILFRIEAPCEWLDAVWEAGDLISLVGTLVLGYVAMLQTKRANDMADDANKTDNSQERHAGRSNHGSQQQRCKPKCFYIDAHGLCCGFTA